MIDEETIGRLMRSRAIAEGHSARLPSMSEKTMIHDEASRQHDASVYDLIGEDWTPMTGLARQAGIKADRVRDSLWRLAAAGRVEMRKLTEKVWEWRRL